MVGRFSLADRFGHPLAPRTTVAVGDDVEAVGDYLYPGDGRTTSSVAVVRGGEVGGGGLPLPVQLETITITVRSPNGDLQPTLLNEGGARRVVVDRP